MISVGRFCFFGVGQGFFYGGKIVSKDATSTFVYDCGVLRNTAHLQSAVSKSVYFLGDKPLDILFVSHFDFDHISGIPQLLKERIGKPKLKRVVLPYYPPKERAYLAFRAAIQIFKTYETMFNEMSTELVRLVANPYEYLAEYAEDITLILGSNPFHHPDAPSEDLREYVERDGIYSEQSGIEILAADCKEILDDLRQNFIPYSRNKRLKCCTVGACGEFNSQWKWEAIVPPVSSVDLTDFWKSLMKKGYIDKQGKPNMTLLEKCCERSGSKERKVLQKLYGDLMKKYRGSSGVNFSSLILAHYPVKSNGDIACSTILLGDTCLQSETIMQTIKHLLTNEMETARIISVPHHGAKSSWNKSVMDYVSTSASWVVSAGENNQFHHPHAQVVKDICLHNLLQHRSVGFIQSQEGLAVYNQICVKCDTMCNRVWVEKRKF